MARIETQMAVVDENRSVLCHKPQAKLSRYYNFRMEQGHGSGGNADSARDLIPARWLAEFEAAARRPLETRFRYAFIKTYKPVLDDATFRAFDTTEDYRRWCEDNLPDWLGYGRV